MSCFFTQSGAHIAAVTPAEMAEVDRIAIEETGPNLFQMMENAGRNLAELILQRSDRDTRVIVIAGIGGNGGGGICAARHLANLGARVSLTVLRPDGLHPVPIFQHQVYRATGAPVVSLDELDASVPENRRGGVTIVDAILGYRFHGPLRDGELRAARWINTCRVRGTCRVVSLDLPSGMDALTGNADGGAVEPDTVMTLALPKVGLGRLDPATELILADIGIPRDVYSAIGVERPFSGRFRETLHVAP